MIVEVKLANYRSIHAEQTLSFVAEKARRHPQNTIQRPGYRLLKAAALFGANASGKSNFVRAIGEMRDFVRDSATKMNDGDPIVCAQPYRLDPESREKPSRFEIVFVTDGVQYTYGFAATRERVHEEWLTVKPEEGGKETLNVRRSMADNAEHFALSVDGLSVAVANLITERTRNNALFLSVAAQFNVDELLPVYRYFVDYITVVDLPRLSQYLPFAMAELIHGNEPLQLQVLSLVRDADIGVTDLRIQTIPKPLIPDATSDMTVGMQEAFRIAKARAELAPGARITTQHLDTAGLPIDFDLGKDESLGTQRLFALAVVFLDVLQDSRFLVIDELDASMHPLLTRRLLEMFQSKEANPNGAQLLFTTHDAVLLDSVLFRRDQIILAEKCDNESRFYSLADIVPPPRNDKLFLHSYLAGRFGATPYLGRAFDDITVEGAK